MHVFLITQYYPPEIGASASRWGDYTDIMLNQGHKVTVLCEMPNYPYGKIFPGYKNVWKKKEVISENFTIIRSAVIANDRSTSLKKLLHYISFAFIATINAFKVKKYDLLIISSPPLFVGLVGLVLNKFKKKEYWLDIRDLWPESVASLLNGKKSFYYKIGKKIESLIYNNAKGIIIPVPGFIKYFNDHPKTKEKLKIELKNGISSKLFKRINETSIPIEKNFIVLYSGNFGLAQGLSSVINSAEILKDYPINFVMIGAGVEKNNLVKLVNKKKLDKVTFYEPVDRYELITFIKKASVCLVPLKNDELFKSALPSKMFEYMACSRPVICNEGEAGDIIYNSNAGKVISPEQPSLIAEAIMYYYNNTTKIETHGKNGYSYIKKNMIKEELMEKMFKEIQNYF